MLNIDFLKNGFYKEKKCTLCSLLMKGQTPKRQAVQRLRIYTYTSEVESRTQGSRPRPRTQKKSEAKDSLLEDRPSRGQGKKCSRPRTKDTSLKCSPTKKKRSSKKFFRKNNVLKKIFQAISKKKKKRGLQKNFHAISGKLGT